MANRLFSPMLALSVLLACVVGLAAPASVAALCPPPTPLQNGDVVNVAVFVWLKDTPRGVFRGNISDTAGLPTPGYGTSLIQPYFLGVDMYVRMMNARGNMLPLRNKNNVKINYIYINFADVAGPQAVDYGAGIFNFIVYSTYTFVPNNAALYANITSQDLSVLWDNFQITQPFTFLVPMMLFLEDGPLADLTNRVEDKKSHIVVNPFASSRSTFLCDGLTTGSLTADCISPLYNRSKLEDERRFDTLFNTIFDSQPNQAAALESMHTLGVKTMVMLRDQREGASFAHWATIAAKEAAAQLKIDVSMEYVLETDPSCLSTAPAALAAANCPPRSGLAATYAQVQVFSLGRTALDVANEMKLLNADALIILAATRSSGSWSMGQLLNAFKVVGYTPKVISFGGGVDGWMPLWLDDPDTMLGTWTTKPWDGRLSGPIYQNRGSQSQFELLGANLTHDGPAVFTDAFNNRYGPGANWGPNGTRGAHGMYQEYWMNTPAPAIGWGTMVLVQKMIEASMTLSVPDILAAAKGIATPGVYHQVQFDQYGRTARVNEMLLQVTRDANNPRLLTPYNIGEVPVYPLPTWDERVFRPVFYSQSNEQIMIALTTISLLLCLLLLGLVFWNRRSPVIRAATPSFCLVIIIGGMMMLVSNFFTTLVVNDAHCAASVWCLTLGFTMVFASLFIKTFRIWKIFYGEKLQVLRMKDWELLAALGVFLLVDVIINAAWQGAAGMHARELVMDGERPAYNQLVCDYSDGTVAVFMHIAIKGGILLFGVGLTYAVRNVPTQFNEATLIGLCIYNVSFVICFILPIVAIGLGGRSTVYLIRAFAIIFVVLTSMGILFIPKLANLSNLVSALTDATGDGPRLRGVGGAGGGNTRVISGSTPEAGDPNGASAALSHTGEGRQRETAITAGRAPIRAVDVPSGNNSTAPFSSPDRSGRNRGASENPVSKMDEVPRGSGRGAAAAPLPSVAEAQQQHQQADLPGQIYAVDVPTGSTEMQALKQNVSDSQDE